eukprot:254586-Hanusia_phi.AAC.1
MSLASASQRRANLATSQFAELEGDLHRAVRTLLSSGIQVRCSNSRPAAGRKRFPLPQSGREDPALESTLRLPRLPTVAQKLDPGYPATAACAAASVGR